MAAIVLLMLLVRGHQFTAEEIAAVTEQLRFVQIVLCALGCAFFLIALYGFARGMLHRK